MPSSCALILWLALAASGGAADALSDGPGPGSGSGSGTGPGTGVGVEERLGSRLPVDCLLVDGRGRQIPLLGPPGDGRPIVIVPAYYRCPQLCGLVLAATFRAAQAIAWVPGRDYRLLTVSIDSDDGPAQALQKQASLLAQAPADGRFSEASWPFTTAPAGTIAMLLRAFGERVQRQADGTIAHPAVAVVLTPDGTISRYLYGIALRPLDLRLALLEAARGGIGPGFERILLYCYRYDPATRRYGLLIRRSLQIGGASIALLAALGISLLVHRVRRSQGDLPP